jgi:hypothetical protein
MDGIHINEAKESKVEVWILLWVELPYYRERFTSFLKT